MNLVSLITAGLTKVFLDAGSGLTLTPQLQEGTPVESVAKPSASGYELNTRDSRAAACGVAGGVALPLIGVAAAALWRRHAKARAHANQILAGFNPRLKQLEIDHAHPGQIAKLRLERATTLVKAEHFDEFAVIADDLAFVEAYYHNGGAGQGDDCLTPLRQVDQLRASAYMPVLLHDAVAVRLHQVMLRSWVVYLEDLEANPAGDKMLARHYREALLDSICKNNRKKKSA